VAVIWLALFWGSADSQSVQCKPLNAPTLLQLILWMRSCAGCGPPNMPSKPPARMTWVLWKSSFSVSGSKVKRASSSSRAGQGRCHAAALSEVRAQALPARRGCRRDPNPLWPHSGQKRARLVRQALLCLETYWRNGRWKELFPHARDFDPSQN
jgi:hypothetical protein